LRKVCGRATQNASGSIKSIKTQQKRHLQFESEKEEKEAEKKKKKTERKWLATPF
jgi:hypothetical protein